MTLSYVRHPRHKQLLLFSGDILGIQRDPTLQHPVAVQFTLSLLSYSVFSLCLLPSVNCAFNARRDHHLRALVQTRALILFDVDSLKLPLSESITLSIPCQLCFSPRAAMAQPTDHVVDQIAQLNAARNLVLGDAAFYPQIVNGILPLIGANSRLELRRWGAEFLSETFASPALPTAQKEQLAATVLQTIRDILEIPESDMAVLKSVVQTAASLYPLVFRHMYVVLS